MVEYDIYLSETCRSTSYIMILYHNQEAYERFSGKWHLLVLIVHHWNFGKIGKSWFSVHNITLLAHNTMKWTRILIALINSILILCSIYNSEINSTCYAGLSKNGQIFHFKITYELRIFAFISFKIPINHIHAVILMCFCFLLELYIKSYEHKKVKFLIDSM
jgi:hypothetical protein